MKDNTPLEYISGQCNIGSEEVKKRLRIGYAGLLLMIVFIIVSEAFHFPDNFKLLLFVPTAYMASGFLQARQRFCFLYAFLGLFSVTGNHHKIQQEDSRRKDRIKAIQLVLQVVLISLLITLCYYYLF